MKRSRASVAGKGGSKRGLKSRIASLEKKLEAGSNADSTDGNIPSIEQISAVIAATQALSKNELKSEGDTNGSPKHGKRKLDVGNLKVASLAVQNIMKRSKE